MSHNVKVKYYARENSQMKPHSFFAQAIANGTYGFDKMCEEAAINTGLEPETIRQAVVLYVGAAKRKLLDGFKVEVGKDFLTLGPSLSAKVKDEIDAETGKVKKAVKADDLTAVGGRSRISVVVDSEFVHEFARSVKWQKSDRSGNPLDTGEEDATLDPDDPSQPTGGNSSSNAGGGSSQQGGGNSGGGSSSQGGGDGDDDVTYD